jgi:hypothetical protein
MEDSLYDDTFFNACERGDIELVKRYLSYEGKNIFINCTEYDNKIDKPYFDKKMMNDPDLESYVVLTNTKQLNLNYKDNIQIQNNGYFLVSPFYAACEKGNKEIIELLLNDPRISNENLNQIRFTRNPFSETFRKHNLEIVKLLLDNDRIDHYDYNDEGYTSLFYACVCWHRNNPGSMEIIKLLLEKKYNLNKILYEKHYGYTNFLHCFPHFEVPVFKFLINLIPDDKFNEKLLKEKDENGYNVITQLCECDTYASINLERIKLILDNELIKSKYLNNKTNENDSMLSIACKINKEKVYVNEKAQNEKLTILKELLHHPRITIPDDIFSNKNEKYVMIKECQDLIEESKKNPLVMIRNNIDTFIHVVLYCDNFYDLKQETKNKNAIRFFKIVSSIPLELQMIMIFILSGIRGKNIPSKIFNDNLKYYLTEIF